MKYVQDVSEKKRGLSRPRLEMLKASMLMDAASS